MKNMLKYIFMCAGFVAVTSNLAAQDFQPQFDAMKNRKDSQELTVFASLIMSMAGPLLLEEFENLVEGKTIEQGGHPLVAFAHEAGSWSEKAQELYSRSFEIAGYFMLESSPGVARFAGLQDMTAGIINALQPLETSTEKLRFLENIYTQVIQSFSEKPFLLPDSLYPEQDESGDEDLEVASTEEFAVIQAEAGAAAQQ